MSDLRGVIQLERNLDIWMDDFYHSVLDNHFLPTIIGQLNYKRYIYVYILFRRLHSKSTPLTNVRGHIPSQFEQSWCFCPSRVPFFISSVWNSTLCEHQSPSAVSRAWKGSMQGDDAFIWKPTPVPLSPRPLVWLTAGIDRRKPFIPTGIKGWDVAWDIKAEHRECQLCSTAALRHSGGRNSVFYLL